MPIDNDIYNRIGETWWDETNPLNTLHGSMTPGRFGYFQEVLTEKLGTDYSGLQALDIGSGGGFLAEEFAKKGFDVVGVDPSEVSVETARAHAGEGGLDIDYRVGVGEHLPVEDATFDVVYCCDVLEHVADLGKTIGETARVLKPGGLYLFDTVNRTMMSKLVMIKMFQEWRLTRLVNVDLHIFSMFIKPDELNAILRQRGMSPGEIVGLGPKRPGPQFVMNLMRARRGKITYGELSRRLDFGRIKSTVISFMGYATKPITTTAM
ncbi:3-demethylubiquinone-9 3-O-methyltransferase [Nocardia donostiensis]|uniref:bifunctional 2-polyprenyl-6-hydroxyphenol methylase/3-demethylubiquinol 3-O-methyltransferase UbiG n=1 Tax=Nocardia donostiensis TaxID=1538463 RepID=UPI0009D980E4|nr:bifunctional 2-polyprenyl-6-hydroxyphenol methylase/3-demethylubiquinol 3-O-methyltransferase UbiG [Nocardia donostiensis]OQS12809.1 3-demethylubiquinone-9 3-O-methyltransferase [Nocardia donostiensis]